jgi:hypothetical protein
MQRGGAVRAPLRQRAAALRVSTAAQLLLSFVVASWAVQVLYQERKENALAATAATRDGPRLLVKVAYGAEVTVSWTDLDAHKRTGWFGGSVLPEFSVTLRGAGGERTHCSGVRDGRCVLGKLKPCGVYDVAVFIAAQDGERRWRRFSVPASAKREELLCKGRWIPMLGGFALEPGGVMAMGNALAAPDSDASRGGASQLAEVVGETPVTLLRLTARLRAAKPDDGASSILVELWHRDGLRSRELQVSLQHADAEWWTQSTLIAVDSKHQLSAVRVAIVTSGFIRFQSVSLKRVLRGDALVRPPPPPPPGGSPALRVRSFQGLFGAWRSSVGVSVALVASHLSALAQLVEAWQGPVTAAVWIVEASDETAVEQIKARHPLVREWVDFHHVEREGTSRYSLEKMGAAAPMNALRNVAISRSRVRRVLELEIGVVPRAQCRAELEAVAGSVEDAWRAVVVPAFELVDGEAVFAVPERKSELMQQVEERSVQQHRVTTMPSAHAATDYYRWFDCVSDYAVSPTPGWEPFVLLDKEQAPPWDERLLPGAFDRMSRAESLAALEYEFIVSAQAFVMGTTNYAAPMPFSVHATNLYASFQAGLNRSIAR